MYTNYNEPKYNYPFRNTDSWTVLAVWQKAGVISGVNSNEWRLDAYGTKIKFSDHGNTNSIYGWEIDHIRPVALGGSDSLSNLQPLYWKTNRRKGDTYPFYW